LRLDLHRSRRALHETLQPPNPENWSGVRAQAGQSRRKADQHGQEQADSGTRIRHRNEPRSRGVRVVAARRARQGQRVGEAGRVDRPPH